MQEAQKDISKPVELQAAAVIAGIPSSESNPLYDDCDDSLQQSIHYHRLTPSMFMRSKN